MEINIVSSQTQVGSESMKGEKGNIKCPTIFPHFPLLSLIDSSLRLEERSRSVDFISHQKTS